MSSSSSSSSSAPKPMFASTTTITPPVHYNRHVNDKNGMSYIRLGNTGVVVSRICLGLMSYADQPSGESKWNGWALGADEGEKFVKQALDAGINYFDTAEIYSEGKSELFFGNTLKKILSSSQFTREDLFISTKIFPVRTFTPDSKFGGIQKGLSRKALFSAVEGSLKRLQTDYIDLYFLHRYDPNTDPEETMHALHDLVTMGKIRYLGASSMFLWQLIKLQNAAEKNGWTKFSVMQNHYNALYREEEKEMIPYCVDNGITLSPWSPLAGGVLCRPIGTKDSTRSQKDQFQRFTEADDKAVIQAVQDVAKARNLPAAQVALAWVLQKQGVSAPIIGATKPHHIEDAVKATQLKLTEEEIKKIEEEYKPHPIIGHN